MTVPSHKERIVSGLGGGLSILIVFGLTRAVQMELQAQVVLIASMGASAVLLFAVPHGPMSQPWNVVGGHTASALIGVLMYRTGLDPVLAAGLAAGLALTAMHYLGCLHPPGGASSLIPILSGPAVDGYGLGFVLFPIGAGAVLMVLVATLYNLNFGWRRYPAGLWPQRDIPAESATAAYPDITHADFVAALAEIDTYVDITEEDLLRIYDIAMRRHAQPERTLPEAGQGSVAVG